MGVEELVTALETLKDRVIEQGVEIMKEEVPVRSGALRDSIHSEPMGGEVYFIGTDIEHAKYVENGRGEVRPVTKKALHWYDGADIFSMYARPTKPNDFVGRTARKLITEIKLGG